MTSIRVREQVKFWLNKKAADEANILEIINWLKGQRAFVAAIRDGLRLIYDLRHLNSTDVLLELFPNIRERLSLEAAPSPDEISRRLGHIEEILEQQPAPNSYTSAVAPTPAPQKLSAGFIPIPTVEDEDDELNMAQSSQEANASNFMSAFAMMDS